MKTQPATGETYPKSDLFNKAALEWIDAVPSDTVLPAMPGFDRDEVNELIANARKELQTETN
ncbi:hypothetical protein B5M10_18625 [Pluralibacter gergoviae]|nr:hypothetical protein [Klebsiella variicola]OUQ95592.1 hypothetical protein B5M10_18625 [Pluralibacter gergoviae]PVW63286.1 hypothetical protein B4U28_11540 [Klebsiella pneumoniae]PVW66606.1 hypothetical protein B4U27_11950 [Klebsiella pneumoniae]PVW72667.1 hypothetical protein B4U25_45525 [Klebsiella pneumoniae]